jgi:hypothetical protein
MKLPYRILVLDDDENALSGIVELLSDAGYHVTGATTYDAAKRLLAAEPFDLFVTDVRLRGYNGLNLVMKTGAERHRAGELVPGGACGHRPAVRGAGGLVVPVGQQQLHALRRRDRGRSEPGRPHLARAIVDRLSA